MTANDIRRRFRQLMDGVVSENMRLCGTTYHINWGISLTHLQSLASEYEQDMHVIMERQCPGIAYHGIDAHAP